MITPNRAGMTLEQKVDGRKPHIYFEHGEWSIENEFEAFCYTKLSELHKHMRKSGIELGKLYRGEIK